MGGTDGKILYIRLLPSCGSACCIYRVHLRRYSLVNPFRFYHFKTYFDLLLYLIQIIYMHLKLVSSLKPMSQPQFSIFLNLVYYKLPYEQQKLMMWSGVITRTLSTPIIRARIHIISLGTQCCQYKLARINSHYCWY